MTAHPPRISVVIPCYNDGAWLPETVRRVRQQTLPPFEIIVVNDGSTDARTLEVLKELEAGGVRVIHQENRRMSAARNRGVQEAGGEYIAALDADDYFHPTFFEKGAAVLAAQAQTAAVTSHIQLFGTTRKISRPRGGGEHNFLFSNQCPACALVRKSCWDAVGGYDEAMVKGYEDWEFYIRITQQGWTVHVIQEVLFFYRQTAKSTHANDTLPARPELVSYIVDKHKDWYLSKLKELISGEAVIYKHQRPSFPLILELLTARVSRKYP